MSVQLNHTIVQTKDAQASATFLADLLGLLKPRQLYHFWVVETGNGVSLDFQSTDREIRSQHYAFLVSEAEFDAIFRGCGVAPDEGGMN